MKCENIQFNLPIYPDGILTEQELWAIDAHLPFCPQCQQKLSDFQVVKQDLRHLRRPEMPVDLMNSVRNRVAEEINSSKQKSHIRYFTEDFRHWLQMRLMPYGVATIISLAFGFGLLSTLFSGEFYTGRNAEIAKAEFFPKSAVLIANNNFSPDFNDVELNTREFAAARISLSADSPTVNPKGALIALTKSIVRGKMKDEEVVVVADVFGDGLARIAEIVEPSADSQSVRELEKALNSNPDFAPPFVPANIDNRSQTVRVILKINRVDIQTNTKTRKQ